MRIFPVHTRIFCEGEDLVSFIIDHIPHLKDGSVLAVTSKIVALSEKRTAVPKDKEKLIKRESTFAVKAKLMWLTLKDGMLLPNAGIDESNANGKLVLLPKNSYRTAAKLRRALIKKYHIKKLGIIITDSRVLFLRNGVVGVALGYAGFRGVKDYRATRDIFGRRFKFTVVNVADSLATTATLTMGEGAECQPFAIIQKAPVVFTKAVTRREIRFPFAKDLYRPLFKNIKGFRGG